jgi:hypothetical protein
MVAVFDFILDFIRVDLIIGFGWYSIFLFIFRLFRYKKEFLNEFDKQACKTVAFLGITYGIVWIIAVFSNYFSAMNEEEKTQFIRRLTGPYSIGYWFQPLFWVVLTQLLRIRFIRKFLIFRLLICISFILTFERFVIIVTSLHRDYLPSSWSMFSLDFGITWWMFILSLIIKIIEFAIIVLAYKYVKKWILNLKQTNKN